MWGAVGEVKVRWVGRNRNEGDQIRRLGGGGGVKRAASKSKNTERSEQPGAFVPAKSCISTTGQAQGRCSCRTGTRDFLWLASN